MIQVRMDLMSKWNDWKLVDDNQYQLNHDPSSSLPFYPFSLNIFIYNRFHQPLVGEMVSQSGCNISPRYISVEINPELINSLDLNNLIGYGRRCPPI
jgi:hypothetical protein